MCYILKFNVMRLYAITKIKIPAFCIFVLFLCFNAGMQVYAESPEMPESFNEFKGVVVDKTSGNPLAFTSIVLIGTNISTVTNTEGEFSIKVSSSIKNGKISLRYMGYKNKVISLSELLQEKPRIEMDAISVELPEVSVISKDAKALVEGMMYKIGENYSNEETQMTAFYRETIKKNKTYASLSEAVVDIYKQPYETYKTDVVKMYKARKRTDYTKVDTLVFKLMGGPFNSLYLDVMKNPSMIFTDEMMKNYEFSFDRSTRLDNRLIYVIDFIQSTINTEPLYYGKLYIDAENLALKSAVFKLNIQDREASSRMFIIRKPLKANAYPIDASYRIDYTEKDGKWYYGYSRIELGLRINWKRKLFNTTYYSTIEMAVTDWEKAGTEKPASRKERLRSNVIVSDEASGFSDPDFWGEFNVIEPEKSIETAIKKIQKQLEIKD